MILRNDRLRFRSNLEEASLDEKIPNSTSLVNIDFNEISCLPSSELTPSSGIFADECLFDNKIRFRQYTEL